MSIDMNQQKLNRGQRKGQEKAAKLLGTQTRVLAYTLGRANWRWTTPALALIGAYILGLGLDLVLFGVYFFPGFLLVLFVIGSAHPARGLAMTDSGVATFAIGGFGPKKPLQLFSYAALHPSLALRAGKKLRFKLGSETIAIREKDYARLAGSVPATTQ
jgi:hypothetical protein